MSPDSPNRWQFVPVTSEWLGTLRPLAFPSLQGWAGLEVPSQGCFCEPLRLFGDLFTARSLCVGDYDLRRTNKETEVESASVTGPVTTGQLERLGGRVCCLRL